MKRKSLESTPYFGARKMKKVKSGSVKVSPSSLDNSRKIIIKVEGDKKPKDDLHSMGKNKQNKKSKGTSGSSGGFMKKKTKLIKMEDSKSVSKKIKKEKRENNDTSGSPSSEPDMEISSDLVQAVLKTLKDLHDEKHAGKELLSGTVKVTMQVTLMKVPVVEKQARRSICLPHSLYDAPELCLFVKDNVPGPPDDVARSPDEKIERAVEYYEGLLKKHKVMEKVSCVIPVAQLLTEYSQYETKRKLCRKFDIFVCDVELHRSGKFTNALGKEFRTPNKFPLPIAIPRPAAGVDGRFLKNINKAIKSTCYHIKGHSNHYGISVGHVSQETSALVANVMRVLQRIRDPVMIPGGVANIAGIYMKADGTQAIPLYINLASRNSVAEPTVDAPSLVPKKHRAVAVGEVTTVPGLRATVLPSGEIFTTQEEEWNDSGEEDEPAEKPEWKEMKSAGDKGKKIVKDESSSEDEGDVTAEAAEMSYLKTWAEAAKLEDDGEEETGKTKEKKTAGKKKGKKNKSSEKDSKNATVQHKRKKQHKSEGKKKIKLSKT